MGCSSSRASSVEKATTPAKGDNTACFHANYRLGHKLGKGAFAQVRVATEVSSGKQWAVKIIDVSDKEDPSEVDLKKVQAMQHEVELHQKLGKGSHTVGLHVAVVEGTLCYLVMEKCEKSLWALLDGLPHMGESELVRIFKQMLTAVAHVHSIGVVHRDIKPDNFLSMSDGITLKLCDFGLSAALLPNRGLKGIYGTAPYMSPEMLSGTSYDGSTDVWSFGVIVYVLFFGQFPYVPETVSSSAMKAAILKGRPKPSFVAGPALVGGPVEPSRASTDFVASLLCRSKEKRPSASQALCNELFALECDARSSVNKPSFRPMLYAASKVGAFEKRSLSNGGKVDCLLSALQAQCQGRSLHMAPKITEAVGDRKSSAPEKNVDHVVTGSRQPAWAATSQESTTCSELSRSKSSTPASSCF